MASSLLPVRAPSIQNGANEEESTMKSCFDRVNFLAKALVATASIIIVAALTGYKDIKQPLDSLTFATVCFLILTLLFGFLSWLYVYYMPDHINLTNWQYVFHVMLVSFDGICLMCINVLLLVLVNQVNALLACFLVVVPFVIGMLAYAGSRINDTNQHLARDQAFKMAMKICCDVAYLTVRCAIPMHVAVVFEYYKNLSLGVNQLPSVYLLVTFLASVLGVFSIMVTAIPLELLPLAERSNLLPLVMFLKNSMLFLTASAAMTLGGKFLDGLVLLVLMPIMVVIVAYRAVLLFNGERVGPDPNNFNEEPKIPDMLTDVTNTCILLLSSVYALYTGGHENGDVYLRVGIFVLVGIIASSLSWIVFLLNPSMNEQRANVTKLVIGILGLMIIIAVAFLLKIWG